jgi:hypothetical protein
VYEDAYQIGKYFGITDMQIYFTGFSSQGDGACFSGYYKHVPNVYENIIAHAPLDQTLKDIAASLVAFQVTAKMQHRSLLRAKIETSGRYCHSHTMDVEIYTNDENADDVHDSQYQFLNLMRKFADWIYDCLEQEYDYLVSDEAIKEALADREFDEDGALI